ncbi:MAG: hypothetical protein Q8O49_00120 [bacterium]|nr:hypothetical protein [bacterium]
MCNFFSDGDTNFKAKCVTASCENCQPITSELTIKPNANCSEQNGKMTNCVCTWSVSRKTDPPSCSINQTIKERLVTIKNTLPAISGINFQITEAFPPTVNHASPGHFNGKAIDISITNANCVRVRDFIKTAKESGFSSGKIKIEYSKEFLVGQNPNLAEYCNNPGADYINTENTTGGHIHLEI